MNSEWFGPTIFGLIVAYLLYSRFAGKVAPQAAKAMIASGGRLVDVRTAAEFAGGGIAGAVNIPVDQLPARWREVGPKETPVVVYCASGVRSARAAAVLRGEGFVSVADLGAMSRWAGS